MYVVYSYVDRCCGRLLPGDVQCTYLSLHDLAWPQTRGGVQYRRVSPNFRQQRFLNTQAVGGSGDRNL